MFVQNADLAQLILILTNLKSSLSRISFQTKEVHYLEEAELLRDLEELRSSERKAHFGSVEMLLKFSSNRQIFSTPT